MKCNPPPRERGRQGREMVGFGRSTESPGDTERGDLHPPYRYSESAMLVATRTTKDGKCQSGLP